MQEADPGPSSARKPVATAVGDSSQGPCLEPVTVFLATQVSPLLYHPLPCP